MRSLKSWWISRWLDKICDCNIWCNGIDNHKGGGGVNTSDALAHVAKQLSLLELCSEMYFCQPTGWLNGHVNHAQLYTTPHHHNQLLAHTPYSILFLSCKYSWGSADYACHKQRAHLDPPPTRWCETCPEHLFHWPSSHSLKLKWRGSK
jgi:hypothetical protein